MLKIVTENLSVGDISHGVFLAQEADGQDDQNNVTHIVMVPKKEPVKIGNTYAYVIKRSFITE